MGWIVGCDTGGTFTDLFAVGPDGECRVAKVPSTPPRFDVGVVEGVLGLRLAPSDVETLFHGTTVTTNAVITKSGAPSALVTTQGFRDVLEIRRANRQDLYDILWDPPPPLVPRRHRLEVDERIDYAGSVVRPLDGATVRDAARRIRARGLESVAICLINAHMNPEHERRIRDILLEELPGVDISLSRRSCRSRPSSSARRRRSRTPTPRPCCGPTWTRSWDGSKRRASAAMSCSSCTTAAAP